MAFPENLQFIRARAGLTQEQLLTAPDTEEDT